MMRSLIRISPLLMAVLLCVGCKSSGPRAYEVTVALDESLMADVPSLEVDLVGVNDTDDAIKSMDYGEGRALRQSAGAVTYRFAPGDAGPKRLSAGDGVWRQWLGSGAEEIMVIASYLPGTSDVAPRRLLLPLGSDEWDESTLRIRILDNTLRCVTPRAPKE